MAFTTRGLRRVPWRAYGLVEDYEYSWQVRKAGERITFVPDAIVWATMLEHGGEAAAHQRRRWEAGRREVQRNLSGKVLWNRRMRPIARVVATLELKTPPMMKLLTYLTVLTCLNLGSIFLLGGPSAGSAAWILTGLSGLTILAVGLYALCPFVTFEIPWRYLGTFVYIPVYAIWKLTLRLGEKPSEWVRTARTEGSCSSSEKPLAPDRKRRPRGRTVDPNEQGWSEETQTDPVEQWG